MLIRHLVTYVILLFLYTSASYANHPGDIPFVVSGVVSDSSGARDIRQFVEYLKRKSGINFKIYYADNYSKLSSIMRQKPVSIGWTCGAPFVEDHKQDKQQLISVPLFHKKPLYHSLIITSVKNKEQKLADFKGKIFAYSDPRSNSGYIAPAVLLKQQGIDIKKHFSLMINTGNHENSIIALLNGLADVAALDEYIWTQYTEKFPDTLNKLHEIERSGPFPFTPIVAGKNITPASLEKIRNILLNMKQDAQGQKILKNLGLDGFVNKPVSFYQPIQQMLDSLNEKTPQE